MRNEIRPEETENTAMTTKSYCLTHQNVQSIGNSVNKVSSMLKENRNCKILCIPEHWKSEDQSKQAGIEGFKLAASFCRPEGLHGGAAVFVSQDVKFKVSKSCGKLSVSGVLECATIDCCIEKSKLIVCTIYRPLKGDYHLIITKLEELLTLLDHSKTIIIAGDFNIDMMDESIWKY
nr:unnamed protein product [Callosobruchus analis]